ncbi:3-demethylubiquinone-9 3-methyltransferase [Thalassoglobus neptunius]|uniref:3-demethylubiquinone-9 3-methyltransferase n=1 Tax=Thalassoglobus neptunius TaxID=1938619 RepID=A0A5C5WH60_9PLAN|nr:VOC family protein [Thalassoglobus neptunius]TWT49990.1 3-demethylubiquinone-9 3-methyltransferase [Thalassoglobus neptunius]
MQFEQKITPFLSFESEAEDAANFYVSVFPDSEILRVLKNPMNGAVMTVEFRLADLTFVALNVGQKWEYTNSISLAIRCESQDEIDHYWEKFLDGGKEMACGWLTDRYGVAWQVVPAPMGEYLGDPDTERATRVMNAMMTMIKLDFAALKNAYENEDE